MAARLREILSFACHPQEKCPIHCCSDNTIKIPMKYILTSFPSHHIVILKFERETLLSVGQAAPEVRYVWHIFHIIGAEVVGTQIADHIFRAEAPVLNHIAVGDYGWRVWIDKIGVLRRKGSEVTSVEFLEIPSVGGSLCAGSETAVVGQDLSYQAWVGRGTLASRSWLVGCESRRQEDQASPMAQWCGSCRLRDLRGQLSYWRQEFSFEGRYWQH